MKGLPADADECQPGYWDWSLRDNDDGWPTEWTIPSGEYSVIQERDKWQGYYMADGYDYKVPINGPRLSRHECSLDLEHWIVEGCATHPY